MSEFTKWRDWDVKGFIGEGSFGKVYRIEREAFGHVYSSALKVIRIPRDEREYDSVLSAGMSEEDAKAYFHDMVEAISAEFALMSELKGNSNIVSFEDYEIVPLEDGYSWDVFIRMELLKPFTKVVKEQNLGRDEVIRMGIDICKALELCEQKKIIHRDIKPENIFLSPQGTYKLGDFGIARELDGTSAGLSKKGTVSYMAPEVYRGLPYGASVDLYSLGVMLYRLMNDNRNPFMPPYPIKIKYTDVEMANQVRFSGKELPYPSNAQDELGDIILKACAYNPAKRYKSATQMRRDLEDYLAGAPVDIEDTEDEFEEPTMSFPAGAVAAAEEIAAERTAGYGTASGTVGGTVRGPESATSAETVREYTEEPDERTTGPGFAADAKPAAAKLYDEEATVGPFGAAGAAAGVNAAAAAGKAAKAAKASSDVKYDRKEVKKAKKDKSADKKEKSEKAAGNSDRKTTIKVLLGAAAAIIILFAGITIYQSSQRIMINGYGRDKNSTYITLRGDEVTPENIAQLNKMPKLEKITLEDAELTEDCVRELGNIKGTVTKLLINNCTGLKDLSPISNLKYLGLLSFYECGVTDDMLADSGFGELEHLKALALVGNKEVTSLEPFRKAIPHIKYLVIDNTSVSDISLLTEGSKLKAFSASCTGISDMSPLKGHRDLVFINLSNNSISDFSTVAGMESLNELRLDGNKITDVSPIAKCPFLMTVFLNGNEIEDLSPLEGHSALVELYVSANKLTSLHGLENELELTYFSAADNKLEDIDGLVNCTQLKEVYLDNNNISDMSILAKSSDLLTYVSISGNPVGSLDVFSKAYHLINLYCDDTGIDSLDPVKGCAELEVISAEGNSIDKLGALGSKPVRKAFLANNKIDDMSVIVEGLTDDDTIVFDLCDNNIKTLIIPDIYYYESRITAFGNPIKAIEVPATAKTDSYLDILGLDFCDAVYSLGGLDNGSVGIYLDGVPLDKQVNLKDSLNVYDDIAYDDPDYKMFSGRTKPMQIMADEKRAARDEVLVIHRSEAYKDKIAEEPDFYSLDYTDSED